MAIAPKDPIPNQERERVQNLEKSIQKGREKLGLLTDDELVGTVCLVNCEPKFKGGYFLHNIQNAIFNAATFDPRTSFSFKKDEVFDIIEPRNVGYKRITLKLKIKDYPTLKNKEDVENIKSFLESKDLCVKFHIKEELDISQVLDYFNEFGVPKSDAQIDDKIAKVNRQRVPLFILSMYDISNALKLEMLMQLLMFYSNSIKNMKIDHFILCFKVVQKQKSVFVNYNESKNSDRNSTYCFIPKKTKSSDAIETQSTKEHDKISAAENMIQNRPSIFQQVHLTNPKVSFYRYYHSVYDLSCSNNSLPTNDPNNQVPNQT
ncbi:hypothetical protein BN7_3711 [Wickerhamomyces ciferrii]|uniref:Uncharacterized protein n=1 Tax=Wickerhamomyces ciferrii (strain ATCC 14091 / BCRC 22168 / CBS 111 / JCM 3599 / NBRC 0793 / NRRL Y-1031 F-60-10) TaxID=1206466 RepID=K0KS23_WICCF|nr:uncharacterized protein BN7_3711 [Wickerhamomyces ciferrii]CCH44153.1 hypothetical protein BN7_3711 [Wickerhamomyces ciferrii]